ncbi:MAG: alginate lyase family protein, partial [bacterium]
PQKIQWQNDPRTGFKYPKGFYHDIDIFSSNGKVDIKHVWELNRLQFLIELAKAWYVTGQGKYRFEIDAVVADWHTSNPYKTGVAWTSALEVGVRAFSLFWTLNFYLAAGNPSVRTVHLLLKLLYLSGRYINENLSIYFSPFNHLIGEAAALFMIGYLFPGFLDAEEWRDRSWEVLVSQVDKQFHEDGGSVEQATFYHHFTLGFYIQCVAFLMQNGGRVPEQMFRRIEKATEFAMYLTRPDGTMPWIGDNDAARSLYFSFPAHWDFRGFQAIGAIWFGRSDMKNVAVELGEEAYWLLPAKEHEKFVQIPTIEPVVPFVHLKTSGYTVLRTGWQPQDHFSFIDCGQIAAGLFSDGTPSAAHGHADLLSFEIAPYGESLLIDPGFSNYRGGYRWHTHFRSTAAHNTLEIDGLCQLEQVGILNWANAPDFADLQLFTGKHACGFCGEHYGFHKLLDKPTHRRYFLFVERSFWVVADYVYSGITEKLFEHQFVHNFHFNGQVDAEWQNDRKMLLVKGKRAGLGIYFLHPGVIATDSEIRIGGPKPQDGWISPTYRERRKAPIATIAFHHRLPFRLITVYLPTLCEKEDVSVLDRDHKQMRFRIRDSVYEIEVAKPKKRINDTGYLALIKIPEAKKAIRLMETSQQIEAEGLKSSKFIPIEEIELVY